MKRRGGFRSSLWGVVNAAVLGALASTVIAAPSPEDEEMLVPRPISRADLAMYLDWLGADQQQQEAAYTRFLSYSDEYVAIRDRHMQQLAERVRTIDRSPFPPPKVVSEALATRRLAIAELQAVDEGFFQEMEETLSEEQTRALPLVRLARDRSFYDLPMLNHAPEMRVDLVRLSKDIALDPDEYQSIEATIKEYQIAISIAVHARHDAAVGLVQRVVAALKRAGVEDDVPADPQITDQLFAILTEALEAYGPRVARSNNRISQTNRRYVALLASQLPVESAATLRIEYLRLAFPGVYDAVDPVDTRLTAALARGGQDGVEGAAVSDLAQRYRQRREQIREKMVGEIRAYVETKLAFGGVARDPQDSETHEVVMGQLRTELADLQASTLSLFADLVVPASSE